MNIIGREWLAKDLNDRIAWLEYLAWTSRNKWTNKKGPAATGPQNKNMASPIMRAEKGKINMTHNFDRFQEDDRPEPLQCRCTYCRGSLTEGDDALVTGLGIFCDHTCYGRKLAADEGEIEKPLTREDIADAAV